LYHLYNKICESDPYEADLFKAVFQYKVFGNNFTFNKSLIGEANEADKLFLRIQKEFGSISRMKAVEAQIEYLKFLNKQGNLKGASILGK
jgi:hypothetical protein